MEAQNNKDLILTLQLIRTENVGPITFHKLIQHFGNAENALNNLPKLTKRQGKILAIPSISTIKQEIEETLKANIKIINYLDEEYPPLLKTTEDHPPVLFIKGHAHLLKKASVAVVGTREASTAAKKIAFEFAKVFGDNGLLVVSGMAKGVDTAAHEGAISKGTAAFLGGGIDVIYPRENEELYQTISHMGVLISEYPLGTVPMAANFPKRNRLIAGISRGVLVVEAALTSGSMITAHIANDLGREVFAIPGFITDPLHKGTNQLIKNGAFLVEDPKDIIQHIKNYTVKETSPLVKYPTPSFKELDDNTMNNITSKLLNILSEDPVDVALLAQDTGIPYEDISSAVLELELCKQIERFPGNKISLAME